MLGCFLPGGNIMFLHRYYMDGQVCLTFGVVGLRFIYKNGLKHHSCLQRGWKFVDLNKKWADNTKFTNLAVQVVCLPLGNRNQILSSDDKGILQRGVFVFPWFSPNKGL